MTDLILIPRELFAFLCGDGPLDGHWFGEKPEHEQGNFWWRKALRAADNRMIDAETIKGIIRAWLDADDATHWGDFEKALDLAIGKSPMRYREALVAIDLEAPANEPSDAPTVGFPPSRDPEDYDGNDVVADAFREGVCRGLWQAAEIARNALAEPTQSRGQAFEGEGEAVPYPRPAFWEAHEKDCEAMLRPRADCTCGPTRMEICPNCSGAGGDNNVSTCARCNGSGGVALSSAKRGEREE